jgi:4-hydroxy-tetrahydrodipicolinate reductase
MDKFPEYDVTLSEIHHIHKKDSPSGTAITLAEDTVKI